MTKELLNIDEGVGGSAGRGARGETKVASNGSVLHVSLGVDGRSLRYFG